MKCFRCESSFLSRHTIGVQQKTADQVEKIAKAQIPNIPVGWAMNGRLDLRCPEHWS